VVEVRLQVGDQVPGSRCHGAQAGAEEDADRSRSSLAVH
jgi:hypothetical protein